MPKIGDGVPKPAKLTEVIDDTFENIKSKLNDDNELRLTLSLSRLTDQQKHNLPYPAIVTPLDVYLFYQQDTFDPKGNLIHTRIQLISFVTKNDKFVYGYYFEAFNQNRISIDKLTKSSKSIKFDENVFFIFNNYVETYNRVGDTTTVLGLNTQVPFASLQYSRDSKYYSENLLVTGIEDPQRPKMQTLGLSENLQKFD